jgi:hypothetical protein
MADEHDRYDIQGRVIERLSAAGWIKGSHVEERVGSLMRWLDWTERGKLKAAELQAIMADLGFAPGPYHRRG